MLDAEVYGLIRQIADKLLRLIDLFHPRELPAAELPAPRLAARTKLNDLWHLLHRTFPEAFTDLDQALDHLLAAGLAWNHPAPVLGRDHPALSSLLAACNERLATAQGDDHRRLSEVKEKLEKTARLNARARRRQAAQLRRKRHTAELRRGAK